MIRTEYGNGEVNQLYPQTQYNRYHANELKYDLEDTNLNISILGKRMKPDSKVLDVACGEGKFGQLYQAKNIQAWGMDIDPVSVEYAQQHSVFKKVICCDVEKEFDKVLQLKTEVGDGFDYIVLCDVLEHFIDPTKVLENMYQVLNENGKILVSIPNAGNADIFLNLLEGRFNYAYSGIMDNTHFHFYTKSSFAQWIYEIDEKSESFSMDCKYLGGTFGVTKYLENVEEKYPSVYQLIQYNPQFQTIQLLFELQKVPKGKYLDILELCKSNDYVLEKIEDSLNDNVSAKHDICLEANERNVLKNEISVLRHGWQECNEKLEEIQKELQKTTEGWQQCNARLEESEKEVQTATEGWRQCNVMLEETQEELQKTIKGWQDCNTKLEEAQEELQNALKGWRDCNAKLETEQKNVQEVLDGWKKCNAELEERDLQIEALKIQIENLESKQKSKFKWRRR